MLVLTTMLVPTISAKATTYTADDSVIISSQYHDFFNNYFDGKTGYLYFPYSCPNTDYNRTCYYGIDNNGKYIKVMYVGSGYTYTQTIETGIDENFAVNGNNIIRKDVSPIYTIIMGFAFAIIIYIVLLMIGGIF